MEEGSTVKGGMALKIPWGFRKEQANANVDTEFGAELVARDPDSEYQLGPDNGIAVEPTPITLGDELKIEYRGQLARSGAEPIYLHYGFGPGDWRFIQDIPMEKGEGGAWTAIVQAGEVGRFSFCFRDNAENWDNNHGRDWSYAIHGDSWH